MDLGRGQRYLEVLVTVSWALAFWLQARAVAARIGRGGGWSEVRYLFAGVRYAGTVVFVASAFLFLERSTQGWAHALFVPTLLAVCVSEVWRGAARSLWGVRPSSETMVASVDHKS